ncbi:MAG: nuclear transport factor 2 family protein [Chloroflexi bacterium]|nr:MAG: nuclear transport factor 2 family protein [Chloroflexota bacterium]
MAPLSLAAGWDQALFEQEPSWIAAGATIDALCEPSSRRVLSRSAAKDVEAARAIERTLLDYFEGWFDGDAARMKRALHPELAKRPRGVDPSLAGRLGTITAQEMIEATAAGVGKTRDVPDRRIEVDVVDVFGDIGSATVRSAVYYEYVHLARTRDGWKIVNTLWQGMKGHEQST